jgi:hypothetical protein
MGQKRRAYKITMKVMLEYLFAEDREDEETLHHKNIRKYIEEPSNTRDDVAFS